MLRRWSNKRGGRSNDREEHGRESDNDIGGKERRGRENQLDNTWARKVVQTRKRRDGCLKM